VTLETLDLPDVGFDTGMLQLLDGVSHEPRTNITVVCSFVALQVFKLNLFRGYEQFKHEQAIALSVEVGGELL
jgi:hypothetical protein